MRCIGRMSYADVLEQAWQQQSSEKLAEEVAAAAAIQNGKIKITEQKWGSIIATNISSLTVAKFKEIDSEQRTKFISALSALKENHNFFNSFERTLTKKKNKDLFDYLNHEINNQSGGAGGIAVKVASAGFMAVIANLLLNNGNTALSQGAISEALAQHSPGEWGKFISTTIGISAKESNVPSVLGDSRYTTTYTPGIRLLQQEEKISQVSNELEKARITIANAMPNAASALFEMNTHLSESILKATETQSQLRAELQTAQAKYAQTQKTLSDSVGWWSEWVDSTARDAAAADAAKAQTDLEQLQGRLVGHIDTTAIGELFGELAKATQQNAEEAQAEKDAIAASLREASERAARLAEAERLAAQPPAKTSTLTATATVRPSVSPAPASQNAANPPVSRHANSPHVRLMAEQKRINHEYEVAKANASTADRLAAANHRIKSLEAAGAEFEAAELRATEVRLAAAAQAREAEAAAASQIARDLATGKVVFNKGAHKLKFGPHEFNVREPMSTTNSDFLKLSGLKEKMNKARKDGEQDGSQIMGVFQENYGVEHTRDIDKPASIFRQATDRLGLTTPAGRSSMKVLVQEFLSNEYAKGFQKRAQEKLELLRRNINQVEGEAAGKDYSALKATLKEALGKNGKIAVPDGKSGTKDLTDAEIERIVNEIVEMAAGVGKMPKHDKITAFAQEILTQLRGTGKLETTRRSWFLRAERNARKTPVEILSDNILLLTLVGTVFGGVAIVGAALENPMKNAMARAANKQGAAAAEATLLQARAAANESRARAEHQRALTAAAKAQAAALLKVTEAKAASNIARRAANNAKNTEDRRKANEKAAAAEEILREAKAAKAAADEKLRALKPNASASRLQRRRSVLEKRDEMPGMEGEGEENDEEAKLEAELEASKARQAAAKATANAAANAAAAQAASNAAATAAAERAAEALRSSRTAAAAAAASPAKQLTAAQLREQRAEAAAKRAGQGGGTRRRRIYRSRTRRHR